MRTATVRLRSLSVAAFFFFFGIRPASAGPLTGQVVDPDSRGVPGAAVLLTDGPSVVGRTATNTEGYFTLAAPDGGEYEVRVALEGFRAKPIAVSATGTPHDLGTITLEISAVSESLVVSAAQVEIPLSTTSSSITIITGDDLARRQVETVADALRMVPGLAVVAAGGRGALTSVFPRGGDSDFSLVFVDGIQANTFGGGFDFSHLPVANIDRIEIVRGPQSALYGSNAIGSVIRIITRRGGAPDLSALVEGGSFNTYRLATATAGEVGAWFWGASAERLVSDGFNGFRTQRGETVRNDDYDRHSVSAALGWRHSTGAIITGNMRSARDERGFPGPFGSDPGSTFGGIDTISRGTNNRWLMSIRGSVPAGKVRINAESTHSRLDGDFVSPREDSEPFESESWSRRTTARLQADLTLRRGFETSAGIELLGERAGGTFITATGNTVVPIERGLAGFFGETRWNPGARLFVAAGLRVERISRQALPGDADAFFPRPPFDEDTVVSTNPKLSAAWYLRSIDGNFTKVRAAAGTGIRPPDAFEIAFTDNPSLDPEHSRSVEAGVDQALFEGRALIEATAFFNRYDDLIVATGSFSRSSSYRTDNISNARSRGFEIAGTARRRISTRRADLHVRVAYTLLDTEILAVDQNSAAPPPFEVGDRLLRRPKHQFSTDVLLDTGSVSAFVQGGGRSGTRDVDPSFGTFGGLFDAPGYSTWSVGAGWKLHRHIEVFGRVTNIFDREYEEALGFPALGRSAIVGLRVAARR